jgi:membrane associated rhomboid family serine protease
VAHASSICPHCGGLNAAGEKTCYRCGQRLPGPLGRGALDLFHGALGKSYPLTKLYVGLCVLVYVLSLLATKQFVGMGGTLDSEKIRWGALIGTLGHHEPWRYLAAMFVHASLLHIAFNMMALWDFGRATEEQLGSGRFSVIFLGTGVLGFVASEGWYLIRGEPFYTVGASGGLFGLIGALIGYVYARRDPRWKQFLTRAVVYLVIMSFLPFINNSAHVGGFVVGLPLGYAFYKERQPWKHDRVFGIVAGVLLLASVGSLALSQMSPAWRMTRQMEIERM